MSKYRQGYRPQRSVQKYDDVNLLKSALRGLFSLSPLSPDNPIHEKSRELDKLETGLLAKGEAPHKNTEYLNKLAGIAESAALDPGIIGKIKVYHGSGTLFDEWDFKKALSGEGATAQGHGAYLAENPKAAQAYQGQEAAKRGLVDTYKGKPIEQAYDDFAQHYNHQLSLEKAGVLEDLGHGKLYDEVLESAKDRYKEDPSRLTKSLLNWVEKDLRKNYKSGGYLYEMELKHRPRDYLQHDLPLKDQPKGVLNKINKMVEEGTLHKPSSPKYDFGSDIYWNYSPAMPSNPNQFAFQDNAYQASRNLEQGGIPGIRYKDQGSRGHTGHPLGGARLDRNKPSYNYVVFPTRDPDIIKVKGLLQ